MSPELQNKIARWRQMEADGTLAVEDMREAIAALRQDRAAAAQATTKARREKAIKAIPTAGDLLDEIGGM